jgi:uncharacterized protein (DUF58 family)
MKKVLLFLLLAALAPWSAAAQQAPKFTVEVSTDSVLWGNRLKVTFTLENASGAQFEAPAFPDFHIVAGPNMSSNFSFINGVSSQSVSYSYYLEPKEIGVFYIQPAAIDAGDQVLETLPVKIMVAPNPDNIRQDTEPKENSRFRFRWDDFEIPSPRTEPAPAPAPEKKRKTTRL